MLVNEAGQLLLSGPSREASPLLRALRKDLVRVARGASGILPPGSGRQKTSPGKRFKQFLASRRSGPPGGTPGSTAGKMPAATVRLVVAYFLPPWRLRLELQRVARRGGRVQLILAGKSDVAVAQLAGRNLYQRMLRAGVEIYEYEPQVLHAKLFIMGGAVYAGSANLDPRSLHLNYELMVRFEGAEVVAQANEILLLNAELGPWIHTGSEVQQYRLPCNGERFSLRGSVVEALEKRGHEIVALELGLFAEDQRPIARIRHRAIIRLRQT